MAMEEKLMNLPMIMEVKRKDSSKSKSGRILYCDSCATYLEYSISSLDNHTINSKKHYFLIQPTTMDYITKSFIDTLSNKDNVYYESQSYFRNVDYRNYNEIFKEIQEKVLYLKAGEEVKKLLSKYERFSCLYQTDANGKSAPLIIQFFDPQKGIDHAIIEYTNIPLIEIFDFNPKLAGYCSNEGEVTQFEIHPEISNAFCYPIFDDMVDTIFNETVEKVLPINYLQKLELFGYNHLSEIQNVEIREKLQNSFEEYAREDRHILSSKFLLDFNDHFQLLTGNYFHFKYTCEGLKKVMSDSNTPLILTMLATIYKLFNEIYKNVRENCFIVCYYKLFNLPLFFESQMNIFLAPGYRPRLSQRIYYKANMSLYLELTKKLRDQTKYYVSKLQNFQVFFWIFHNKYLDFNHFHTAYHMVDNNSNCVHCSNLMDELMKIKSILGCYDFTKPQPHKPDYNVIWSRFIIFCENNDIKLDFLPRMLQYIFSLPISKRRIGLLKRDQLVTGDVDECASYIRFNFKMTNQEFITKAKEDLFSEDEIRIAKDIIGDIQYQFH